MIIIFNVTYPDSIDPSAAKKILQLLPQPKNKNPQLPKDVEEVQLEVFDGKIPSELLNPQKRSILQKQFFLQNAPEWLIIPK